MSKLGLDDDIIIAKIKNGSCEFQLGDTDIVYLKKAGVSPKVIAAMLDSSVLTSPRVTIENNEVPLHTMGQSKVGGRLGSKATFGMKSVKEKAYLDGPHSTIVASSSPVIEIDLPKSDTIDNYVLVQMDGKSDRRELEVESRGGIVGGKNGIRAEAIQKTHVTPLGDNKFQLGTETLKKGEYIIYVVGSPDSVKGIYGKGYDFTVSSLYTLSHHADKGTDLTSQTTRSQIRTVTQESSVGPVPVAPMPQAQSVTASPESQEAQYAETPQEVQERAARNTVVVSESSEGGLGEQAKRAKQRTACLKLAADNPSITCK
ncbi:MAG: hypothetical protein WB711_20595 [Terriglobales bacterium]